MKGHGTSTAYLQKKRSPKAPRRLIRHPHPDYPLASYSLAELASVSPEPLCNMYSDYPISSIAVWICSEVTDCACAIAAIFNER